MPKENKAKIKLGRKLTLIALTLVLFATCWLAFISAQGASVAINGKKVSVVVADDVPERTQGLSGRASLNHDEGMLFIFDRAEVYPFWMKNMNFSIDIIWIGQDKQVVYIQENALPSSYPELFTPNTNALYVLEVNAGFVSEYTIKVGDLVDMKLP